MEQMVLKRKRKQYEMVDEYGNHLGVIEIDLTDKRLKDRVNTCEKNILALIEKAKSISSEEDEEKADAEVTVIDDSIKEEINKMLDFDVSSVAFGNTHCLTTHDGITLVETFMEMLLPYVKADIEKERKGARNRVDKYKKKG